MKKKEYTKPTLKEVKIQLSELCAGSVCTEIDITVDQGAKIDGTHVVMQGQTKTWWDAEF